MASERGAKAEVGLECVERSKESNSVVLQVQVEQSVETLEQPLTVATSLAKKGIHDDDSAYKGTSEHAGGGGSGSEKGGSGRGGGGEHNELEEMGGYEEAPRMLPLEGRQQGESRIVFGSSPHHHQMLTEIYPYPQQEEANFFYPPYSYPFIPLPPPPELSAQIVRQEFPAYNFNPAMVYPPHIPAMAPVLVGSPPMWMLPQPQQPQQPQQWFDRTEHANMGIRREAAEEIDDRSPSEANVVNPGPPIQLADEKHGPENCNLFVFHVPNEMTNIDLFHSFIPFGNVISARIMVDVGSGRSRGFGFVSYDNPSSALHAIENMNGLQMGNKRLKVQLKKEKVMGPHLPVGYGPDRRKGKGKGAKGGRRNAPIEEGGPPCEGEQRLLARLSLQDEHQG